MTKAAVASKADDAPQAAALDADSVIELRRYLLYPGQRDALIDLFEREFIESQEAVGAHIVGTFHDLDSPDHFVWLRSFADMKARAAALRAFYFGPVWREHREAANATMIDSDDVRLLHVVGTPPRLPDKHPPASTAPSSAMFVVDTCPLRAWSEQEFDARLVRSSGVVAAFAREESPNSFPRVEYREPAAQRAACRIG
jgi:hypothetical protein